MDEINDKTKMISQQLEQQKEYVAYKEAQQAKNDSGKPRSVRFGAGGLKSSPKNIELVYFNVA